MSGTSGRKSLTPERQAALKWRADNQVGGLLVLGILASWAQLAALVFSFELDQSGTSNPLVKYGLGLVMAWIATGAVMQVPWTVRISRPYWLLLLVLGLVEPFAPYFLPFTRYPGGPPIFSDTLSRAFAVLTVILAGSALAWSRGARFQEFLAYIRSKNANHVPPS